MTFPGTITLMLCAGVIAPALAAAADATPLTDFAPGETYREESGGLYGDNRNAPPTALASAADDRAKTVVPRDPDGHAVSGGKIGFISIGMSNTALEFRAFQQLGTGDVSPAVKLVNGARGGMDATDWANPAERRNREMNDPWKDLLQSVQAAGLTAAQVQVAWITHAHRRPEERGEYPRHAQALTEDLRTIVKTAKKQFPNLTLVYLSSRNYAGYATTRLNPEPFAYESAFAVRALINSPDNGKAGLPVMLWGPYTWANGAAPRRDGLKWELSDFNPKDGTHPSPVGAAKVARLLLGFLNTDPSARPWWHPASRP